MVSIDLGQQNLLKALSFAIFNTQEHALKILASLQYTVKDLIASDPKKVKIENLLGKETLLKFYKLKFSNDLNQSYLLELAHIVYDLNI